MKLKDPICSTDQNDNLVELRSALPPHCAVQLSLTDFDPTTFEGREQSTSNRILELSMRNAGLLGIEETFEVQRGRIVLLNDTDETGGIFLTFPQSDSDVRSGLPRSEDEGNVLCFGLDFLPSGYINFFLTKDGHLDSRSAHDMSHSERIFMHILQYYFVKYAKKEDESFVPTVYF
jgi:hypothetical protein